MQKEANFMKSVETFVEKHGVDYLTAFDKPKSKKAVVPAIMELEPVKNANIEEYQKKVEKSLEKHKKLYETFKEFPNVEALIYRYDYWGFLNNISLSVHPDIKKKWKINYEMFGAFYNVDLKHPYNSLFHDLEEGSQGNVFYYKPKEDQIVLVNPPYTVSWIRWTCRKILDEWKGKATFYVVIPAWDCLTRKKLNLKEYECFSDIVELIENAKQYKLYDKPPYFPFWDGISQKESNLGPKVPIHVIKI